MFAFWPLVALDLDEFWRCDVETDVLDRRSDAWIVRRIEDIRHRPEARFARALEAERARTEGAPPDD